MTPEQERNEYAAAFCVGAVLLLVGMWRVFGWGWACIVLGGAVCVFAFLAIASNLDKRKGG
jgi:hypothetical protein